MYNIAAVSFGEIFLKGKNRGTFESKLISQIKYAINEFNDVSIYKDSGKVYIETKNEEDMDGIIEKVRKVFGITILSPSIKTTSDTDIIIEKTKELFEYLLKKNDIKTFKIRTKRSDKKFPIKSMDFSALVGGKILEAFSSVTVDVHNPDVEIFIDIRKNTYISSEKIKTLGGLPIGSNGRALLLLSGGIDSPVAGYMMARRGIEISAIHYVSPPYTSERARMKVEKLCEKLTPYCGDIKFYCVPFTEIQEALRDNCPEELFTIIMRRLMIDIAQRIAKENNIQALITGESVGQVASQTIGAIVCTDAVCEIPMFRPVVGMDKTEIIEISRKIDTFDISIEPYEDCCTVFTPKHPKTRPVLADVDAAQKSFDFEPMIQKAVNDTELKVIKL